MRKRHCCCAVLWKKNLAIKIIAIALIAIFPFQNIVQANPEIIKTHAFYPLQVPNRFNPITNLFPLHQIQIESHLKYALEQMSIEEFPLRLPLRISKDILLILNFREKYQEETGKPDKKEKGWVIPCDIVSLAERLSWPYEVVLHPDGTPKLRNPANKDESTRHITAPKADEKTQEPEFKLHRDSLVRRINFRFDGTDSLDSFFDRALKHGIRNVTVPYSALSRLKELVTKYEAEISTKEGKKRQIHLKVTVIAQPNQIQDAIAFAGDTFEVKKDVSPFTSSDETNSFDEAKLLITSGADIIITSNPEAIIEGYRTWTHTDPYRKMLCKPTAAFVRELVLIRNAKMRNFAIEALRLTPKYIWEIPSSSTGKYHHQDEIHLEGQTLHVKRVFEAALKISNVLELSPEERDMLLVAALLHDMAKYGHTDEIFYNLPLRWEHYPKHSQLVGPMTKSLESKYSFYGKIISLVEGHDGQWSEKKPETELQWLMHLADYFAAERYSLSIDVIISYYKKLSDLGYAPEEAIDLLRDKQEAANKLLKKLEDPSGLYGIKALREHKKNLLPQGKKDIIKDIPLKEAQEIVSKLVDAFIEKYRIRGTIPPPQPSPLSADDKHIFLRDINNPQELTLNFLEMLISLSLMKKRVVLAFDNNIGGLQSAELLSIVKEIRRLKKDKRYKKLFKNFIIINSAPKNMYNKLQKYFLGEPNTEIFMFARIGEKENLRKLTSKARVHPVYINEKEFLLDDSYYPLLEIVTITLASFLDPCIIDNISAHLNKMNIAAPIEIENGVLIFNLLPNARKLNPQEYINLKRFMRSA